MDFLTHALAAAERGWKVIPLHTAYDDGSCSCKKKGDCPSPGKHPRISEWQKNASGDEAQIMAWGDTWPESNMGIKLGPDSGIIDIEFDDDEGRKVADELMGECYTPTFSSGRSVHRLFKYDPELPDKAVEKINGLEIRIGGGGQGAQSVFPESRHASGVIYQWLPGLSPDDVDVIDIPDRVLAVIYNGMDTTPAGPQAKTSEEWQALSTGVSEGGRNEALTKVVGGMLRQMKDADDTAALQITLQALRGINASYSPPLPDDEVEIIFKSVVKRERLRRANESTSGVLDAPPEEKAVTASKPKEKPGVEDYRLEIYRSEPDKEFRLYAPLFSEAPGGYISLSGRQMQSAKEVAIAIREQAEREVPPGFSARWAGNVAKNISSLREELMSTCTKTEADLEDRLYGKIAERILEMCDAAPTLLDGAKVSAGGRPTRLQDGDIVFKYNPMHDELRFSGDRVSKKQFNKVLRDAMTPKEMRQFNGVPGRFKVIRNENLTRLRMIVANGQPASESVEY